MMSDNKRIAKNIHEHVHLTKNERSTVNMSAKT